MLINEELWFTRALNLNDPYDCFHTTNFNADYNGFSTNFDLNIIFQQVRVCSLTDNPHNFLMWSYYNQHRGLCLGLNMDVVKKCFGSIDAVKGYVTLKKVKYQSTVPSIDPYDIMPKNYLEVYGSEEHFYQVQNIVEDFLSTKARWWENENEYRLIFRKEENNIRDTSPSIVHIPRLIKSIYIGNKYEGEIEEIINIASSRNIEVYREKLKVDDFGLEPERILW